MRLLTNTNVIVDDFDYCKNYPKGTFIHFLTHYHADHYKGITPAWDYGPIYCSEITKNLILLNFPNIKDIRTAELNTPFTFPLNSLGTKTLTATFFDANHIPGSVMVLFQGYMGTILHTGDMRFKDSMLLENTVLFPVEKRNKNNHKCSIHIDELILDNTYLNPVHKFPDREKAIKMVIDTIEKNRDKHIIIAMGILGKERIALEVSRHFQTTIQIPEKKYKNMQAMNFPVDTMTTSREEGCWIEVIHKNNKFKRLEEEKAKGNKKFIMISVEFTGTQAEHLTAQDGMNYLVPYSQHSNYQELEKFVKSICPSILKKLVLPYLDKPMFKNRPINNLGVYFGYVNSLKRGGKSAFTFLLKTYTNMPALSASYKGLMTDEAQKELMKELNIPLKIDVTKRRVANKKKKALEDELESLIKKKVDVQALERKVFHATTAKRRSFADHILHKRAISSSMSLDVLFGNMTGKKKVKMEEGQQKKEGKEVDGEMEIEMKKEKFAPRGIFELMESCKREENMEGFSMRRIAEDQELLLLLNSFMDG